jgi:hypothetical protein
MHVLRAALLFISKPGGRDSKESKTTPQEYNTGDGAYYVGSLDCSDGD